MGHRKRAPPSHKKALPIPSAEIKQECSRALNALRRGNYNKGLRLIKEASARFENSALFHRVSGTIAVKVAGIIDDPAAKNRHLRSAVESAKKARVLSPNSIEYAHFYANLLLEVSNDSKELEEVVSECERAIAMENPNDPALDELEKDEAVSLTVEAKAERIAQVQSELRAVIQKANLASISSWMKHLNGNGEDKFRFIQMIRPRAAEDPVEARYLTGNGNVRRSHEIKRASKTMEEKRKDIEVRVAAARLLQQKNEQQNGEECNGGSVLASGSGSIVKVGERRRYGGLQRNGCISERKDLVRSFWNSTSFEIKRGLLSIRVSDLRAYLDSLSSKDGGQAGKIFSEALAFGEVNQTWKFWACSHCGEKFADASVHRQHVIHEHLGILSSRLQSVLPESVDSEWEEMLISCSWQPLDLTASVRMLEDQSKPEVSEFSGRKALKDRVDDCWDDSVSCEKKWDSFQEKKNEEDDCNGSFWENGADDENSNIEGKTFDRKVECKMYDRNNSWPISDDSERAKLLKKISSLFQVLLRQKCLAVSHLQKVLIYTVEELQGLFPDSQILSSGVNQTPLCICFLGPSSLRKIADFLQKLSYSCGFPKYPEEVSVEDISACLQALDWEIRVTLNETSSSFRLDDSLLSFNSVRGNVGSGSSIDGLEKCGQSDSDYLLSWIYAGPPSADQLAKWSQIREERSQEFMKLLETLIKEYIKLETLCEKKHELLGYEEALQRLEELCVEECKKREQVADVSYCSYESIFHKRRDELVEGDTEATSSKRLELEAISTVLKEAETLHVSQYGYEDSFGGIASNLCELEAGEEDWRSQDYPQQLDRCMEAVIQRQKEHMSVELTKVDAQIMCELESMSRLQLNLEPISVLDYRFILLPLVKSFMRAHLEDLAEKDATEKSDAVREAFLAELALDSKKCSGRGNSNGKTSHEKMKDKKRNKDFRRIKDSKLGGFNDQLETAGPVSLAATSDGDAVDSDILESENNEELDDEFQRKLELEAEERKLEETLEHQRQLESEAKQRLLAEQQKQNSLEAIGDDLDESGDILVGISEPVRCKQVTHPCKNDNANSLNGSQRDSGNDTCSLVADDEFVGTTNSYLKPGLPSICGLSNGVLPFEQQAGKRGKRRHSAKVPEGRHQTVSYVKENYNLENSTSDIVPKDQAASPNSTLNQGVGDGGSKTLRQLQAEEDEEERFQADLRKAVMQSLDTFEARQKMSLVSNPGKVHKRLQDFPNFGTKADGVASDIVNCMDLLGPGLQNEVGEYNCFLNVIIQSLWHLRRFREEFLRRSALEHIHVGNPCVVCALFEILTALTIACGDANREPVTPSMLRTALSNFYPENNFFQEGQMNDASEVLGVIFDCLHRSFTSGPSSSDSISAESNGKGSWDCFSSSCIAHTLFGMDIFERMNCSACGLESRHLKYTSFFHNINASALRTMQVTCPEISLAELFNSVEMNHQVACDPEVGGCGKLDHIHHILSTPPHVFTAVLGWQYTCESLDDIKATLKALSTEIDISILYRGLDPPNLHRLVSVVCYYGQHYHCFAYSHDHEKWIMYDDQTVKVIGSWDDVISMCERGHLQPQVLFFEAVN